MSGLVNLGASLPLSTGGTPTRRSPNLDAQLATCRAQLADWVTCDSAKTPEGKAKIAQISTQVDTLKKQIADAGKATSRGTSPTGAAADPGGAASPTAGTNRPNSDPDATLGRHLDLYA